MEDLPKRWHITLGCPQSITLFPSPVAPFSEGSASLLCTQSPQAGETPALLPSHALGVRQCLLVATAGEEPSSTRNGEEASPSPGGASGLRLCMVAARATYLPSH